MVKYIQKSFRRELLLGFIVVAILPLILTAGFLIQLFQVKLAKDYRKQDLEQAGSIKAAIELQFLQFEEIAEQICTDGVIIGSLPQKSQAGTNEIYSRLYEATGGMRDAAQFDVYTGDGVCECSTGTGVTDTKLPEYWGILRVAAAHPGELVIQSDRDYTGETDILLRAARAIRDGEENTVGYLVIGMRAENFEQILGGLYGGQDGICILNRFWENVYSTGTAEKKDIAGVLRDMALAGEKVPESYQDNSIYITEIGETGFYSVYMRREAFTEDIIRAMYRVTILMTLMSLVLCIGVSVKLSGNLTKPVSCMKNAMQQVQEGNLDVRIEADREDEFRGLAENFNTMTVELKDYMESQIRQQRELDEANIAMMQAQLNPHFLYNTLDTMKWVAKANGIQELAVMATKLAKILRTSITKEQFITLREELELVESYVEIQKIRFSNRFSYQTDVPEELMDCIVPKLMIQPIVENALLHGLADREDGHITVTGVLQEEELRIEVQDDGCGIRPEIMVELNSRNQRKAAGHLGFGNVDTIIRLNYGNTYGLRVDAPETGGTRVTMILPAQKGEGQERKDLAAKGVAEGGRSADVKGLGGG